MKIMATIFMLWLFCEPTDGVGQEIDVLRNQYPSAVTEKATCQQLIEMLRSMPHLTPTRKAYLGALEAIWANHVFNPISKLNTFQDGKAKIEQAVAEDPDNCEIRYLRLSIQKNVPGFLGYNAQIQEDQSFLKENISHVSSKTLKDMIKNLIGNAAHVESETRIKR